MSGQQGAMTESTKMILVLFFLLLALVCLLLFLYKKLNREAEGEYTIRRMVYKKGGVRDRVRGAAVALGSRLGVQLWPGGDPDEDGEEMRDFTDVEGGDGGSSSGSLAERNQGEEEEEGEEAPETSDDTSRSLSSEEEEEVRRNEETDSPKSEEKEAREEENGGGAGPEQVRGEAGGGAGLLIDLKQFSGSAIWSGEESCAEARDDITAL